MVSQVSKRSMAAQTRSARLMLGPVLTVCAGMMGGPSRYQKCGSAFQAASANGGWMRFHGSSCTS